MQFGTLGGLHSYDSYNSRFEPRFIARIAPSAQKNLTKMWYSSSNMKVFYYSYHAHYTTIESTGIVVQFMRFVLLQKSLYNEVKIDQIRKSKRR